ncbi:MAG: ECF-type sigma factor [bacterium]|nr:ECF-type sigma factor [bacterium]
MVPEQPPDDDPVDVHIHTAYDKLREVAAGYLRRLRPGQTVQPTEVVHEAYLRLQASDQTWRSRSRFLAFASKSIRNLLIDHVRARAADKRGGDRERVTLSTRVVDHKPADLDLIDLHEALELLTERDERQGRIVEMRFFGNMSTDEIAEAMRISPRTVRRELRMAQSWLMRELDPGSP